MSIFTKLSSLLSFVWLPDALLLGKTGIILGMSLIKQCVCAEYSTQLMYVHGVANSRVSDCLLSWHKYIYIWTKMFHRLHIMWNSLGSVLGEDIEWRYFMECVGHSWPVLRKRPHFQTKPSFPKCFDFSSFRAWDGSPPDGSSLRSCKIDQLFAVYWTQRVGKSTNTATHIIAPFCRGEACIIM